MILLSNKKKNFYTWFENRTPRRIGGNNKRAKRKRNREREKRRNKDSSKSMFSVLEDTKLPIVKIMRKDEVV